MKLPRPTLAMVFLFANLSLAVLLGLLDWGVLRGSRESLGATAELASRASALLIGARVESYLDSAARTIDSLERQIQSEVFDPRAPAALEAPLLAALLNDRNLAGISLTHARLLGFDDEEQMIVSGSDRWQVAIIRETPAPDSPLTTLMVEREGAGFAIRARTWRPGDAARAAFSRRPEPGRDPTASVFFETPASRPFYERRNDTVPGTDQKLPVWSDLSYLEQDASLPERRRGVAVSAMRAIEDRRGTFVGIVRTGLRTEVVDRIVREEQARSGLRRIVICDEQGRLITRLAPDDPLAEQPDHSLRVVPRGLPVEIARALRDPSLQQVRPDDPRQSQATARFVVGDRPFRVGFRGLARSQGWRVAVVVAEDELPQLYPRFADQIRRGDMLLGFSLLVSAAILLGGYLTLRSIGRSLRRIEGVSGRMRQFDFVAADSHSPFRDIEDVMQGLELAKTAMRALSKYVPVDLVRILYRTGREPVLGGELTTVSLLFTDIQGFTTLSEQLPPNELAQVLGRYLEVMTAAIQSEQGTIDKYIGDAIMAVWNAPTACPEHARRACAAALAALGAGQRLFGSPEWQGRPPLATRFGIHADQVMVGHFGAPNRMSYTCLGDGVNLAARLEGLNKQYATTILVSEAVQREAGPHFQFRLVDVVAVKGKHQGVPVYELIGAELVDPARLEQARRYEQAFALYRRRDFEAARALLVAQPDDGPSRVLAERCAQLAQDPPPPDWDGVFVAMSK